MLRLNELGWGAKRIAQELGVSRNTAKGYIAVGGWTPYRQPERKKTLDGLEPCLRERLRRLRGNADVIRQELATEGGIKPAEEPTLGGFPDAEFVLAQLSGAHDARRATSKRRGAITDAQLLFGRSVSTPAIGATPIA
jgi:hypothetical protein